MIVKKVKVRVKNKNNYLILLAFVILVQLAGGIGAYFTTPNIPIWYESLNKPSFTPPNWIFGPVWTLLYLLMGISAYQVWSKGWEKPDVKSGLYIFLIQLVLNILWSVTFFDIRSPKGAFVVILFLIAAIWLNIKRFYKIEKQAGYLLIPYLTWTLFASYLNLSIAVLN